jgi:hypothetical protein
VLVVAGVATHGAEAHVERIAAAVEEAPDDAVFHLEDRPCSFSYCCNLSLAARSCPLRGSLRTAARASGWRSRARFRAMSPQRPGILERV